MYTTKQEIFDAVYAGLESQNWEPSVDNEGQCMYRGEHGRKCAAGWLIPDEKYKDVFESIGVQSHGVEGDMLWGALSVPERTLDLEKILWDLQKAHDYASDRYEMGYRDMKNNVLKVGANHGLTVPGD